MNGFSRGQVPVSFGTDEVVDPVRVQRMSDIRRQRDSVDIEWNEWKRKRGALVSCSRMILSDSSRKR